MQGGRRWPYVARFGADYGALMSACRRAILAYGWSLRPIMLVRALRLSSDGAGASGGGDLVVLGLEAVGKGGTVGVEGLTCTDGVKSSTSATGTCNKTVSNLFTEEMFEGMFKHRNDRVAHAPGFWSYGSFLSGAKMFERAGFSSIGGDDVQKRELAAFFAHVAHETSCGWPGSKDGSYAWGLCYNQELSPSDTFCMDDLRYPCAPGAAYYGCGSLPLYWNYNYGLTGAALKQDLLHHPDMLAYNETVAWQAAIWYWMTPGKARPSPHQVMVGKWPPSKNDTLANRHPGFGMTINIKAGNGECGHGDDTKMQDRIGHYLYILQGYFGGLNPGPHRDCGSQRVLPLQYPTL